jgi:hypothetical protein
MMKNTVEHRERVLQSLIPWKKVCAEEGWLEMQSSWSMKKMFE